MELRRNVSLDGGRALRYPLRGSGAMPPPHPRADLGKNRAALCAVSYLQDGRHRGQIMPANCR